MDLAAVVGLGNPGPQYAATRHNVGFMVVDELAARWRISSWRAAQHCAVARRGGSVACWLVKPQQFMNCSGPPLRSFLDVQDLAVGQALVVVDDVELPLGQLRLRPAGGAGTHNGLRSLVESVGEGFPRLRLGIRGEQAWRDLADYVLAPFDEAELAQLRTMVKAAADCVEMALRTGIGRTASRFNRVPDDGNEGVPPA
jgi:peptidyl-tRNA hydrolase, PTH1 family